MEALQSTYMSLDQMKNLYLKREEQSGKTGQQETLSFSKLLEQADEKRTQGVNFSKHANDRLASRNISLSGEQLERLNRGILQAKEKQIRESLVMMDDIVFIVNVNSRTVITAMDQEKNNVFTNIDGAVIV